MNNRVLLLAGALIAALVAIAALNGLSGRSHSKVVAASTAEPTSGGQENEISARDHWFFHQRAQPAAHTPPGALERAVKQSDALDRSNRLSPARLAPSSVLSWARSGPQPIKTIGPDASTNSGPYVGSLPVAGRVTAIAPDPVNANVAYLGSANGGVWKTTDGGATWAPKFDFQPSLAIGALSVDPSNTQNVWAGTGEPNSSGDSYYGAGIYKSANGGSTWARQGGASFLQGCFVFKIAIVTSSIVVAAVGEYPGIPNPSCGLAQRGIWRTTNGGANWSKVSLPGSGLQAPTDLAQPTSPKTTIYTTSYNEGLWRSTDGGATWAKLTGLTIPGYATRGVLAVAPNAANVLYVAFTANDNTFGQLSGVWKSANAQAATAAGSVTFSQTVGLTTSNGPCNYPSATDGQCTYDLDLAVDPGNSTVFFLGGIRMFRYTNSGTSSGPVAYGSCATCIHVDQHAAVFGPGPKFWVGSDGGVYNSATSPYTALTNRNSTLGITQFNGWTSGSLGSTFIGGTQDNGTAKFTTATGLAWNMTHGGDGGASALASTSTWYASYFGKDVYRTTNTGSSYTNISGAWGGANSGDGYEFYPPMEMSPSSTTTLYRGTTRIWRGTSVATSPSWTAISPQFNAVTAIGPAKSSSNVIYAGFDSTSSSGSETSPTEIRYTTNATNVSPTWTAVTASNVPVHVLNQDRYVTDFSVSPTNPNIAYVAFSGFNASTPTKPGHVFRTTNGGTTWTNVSTTLPDIPVDSIYVDYSKSPAVMYAGTDLGVYWAVDSGTPSWGRGGGGTTGLPYTPVTDVRVDGTRLIAATHGRGVFQVPAPSAIAVSSFSPASAITGSNVIISGTNLQYVKNVLFGGTKLSPAVSYNPSTKQVTAKVPDGLTSTPAKIAVKTGEGITALSASTFVPSLSITSFAPGSGAVGSTVHLNGVGFGGIGGAGSIKFNGVPAVSISNLTGTSVDVVVPVGATTGKITVQTGFGTVQSATSFTVT